MPTISLLALLAASPFQEGGDRLLFDFEKDADAAAWSNLEPSKEPSATVGRSPEGALRITFAGGRWPSVRTAAVPDDWSPWKSFSAELTVGRDCLVGFQAVQEKSLRSDGWDGVISRWARTLFLKPGRNAVTLSLEDPSGNGYGLNPKRYGKVTSLELFFYAPRPGETLEVDAVRLLSAKAPPAPPSAARFKVAGTDLEVSGIKELGQKLKSRWSPPEPRTVEQIEADFAAQYERIRAEHPKALRTTLREGEHGFAGWRDAHMNSHGPDANTEARARNTGAREADEAFMRHRSLLFRVDLSAVPPGSTIHAARFLLVAGDAQFEKGRDPRVDANMWAAEPCRRPWVESELNAYEYAKDRFWKAAGGLDYGADPDFHPLFLAHGRGGAPVSSWDFTEAVRFWTDGRHENHGFMLHGDSFHYMGRVFTRESRDVRSRPALLLVYEPR